MKTNLLKFLRGIPGNGLRLNKKVTTFAICLAISTFFWIITVFSKQYNTVINVPAQYINLPSDKIASELPTTIGIEVRASGFRILLFKLLKKENKTITIDARDVKPYKKEFYLTTKNKAESISKQLNSEFKIINIHPDTLWLDFNNKAEKIVPVKLNLVIDYEKQFFLRDSIRISPNAIQISGPSDIVDKIDFIETEKIIIEKAKESITSKVPLISNSKKITLSFDAVNVTIPITQYTEGNIELPLAVENLLPSYSIKTFPDKINLKYMVTYEDYNKINQSMFKVVVDYSKSDVNSNRLKVEVRQFPSKYISEKSIKVIPEKVEYIIRKK